MLGLIVKFLLNSLPIQSINVWQKGKKKEVKFILRKKPVALYSWILDNYAKEGDKIFDPFLGSGSSRIAAYMKGFDFYACELDKEYYDLQEKRFRERVFGEVKVNDKITIQQQDLF
jgi:site-specific DNA-methyltransferase (adenine-specific)